MINNLIGIHTLSVSSDIHSFTNNGYYRTIPMVLFQINDEPVSYFSLPRPIEIFKENMNYSKIANAIHSDEKIFSLPGKAYQRMMSYVNQNVNKVVADMIVQVIIDTINKINSKESDSQNFFFIDSIDANKIIGRLGYLYIKSDSNTIAFVTYKSGGLLTDTLNYNKDKMLFDINYFSRKQYSNSEYSSIIPNDYMESLTQAVFYNFSSEMLSPLRCDIFSQGISTSMIKTKVEQIKSILFNKDNMTPPFQDNGGNMVKIPRVLYNCIQAENTIYSEYAKKLLEVQ